MTLKDADKIKEAIKNSDDFVGGSDDIIKVIDSVPEVVINTDTDTISRKAAIDIISQHTFYDDYDDTDKCSLLDGLSALPYAQPERIKGRWRVDGTIINCSVCGNCSWSKHSFEYIVRNFNFCPNCGAELEKEVTT